MLIHDILHTIGKWALHLSPVPHIQVQAVHVQLSTFLQHIEGVKTKDVKTGSGESKNDHLPRLRRRNLCCPPQRWRGSLGGADADPEQERREFDLLVELAHHQPSLHFYFLFFWKGPA